MALKLSCHSYSKLIRITALDLSTRLTRCVSWVLGRVQSGISAPLLLQMALYYPNELFLE